MRILLRQRLARWLLAAAAVGSLTDWVTFSALVAVLARLTQASIYAVALVTAARVLPAIVLGPLFAPFAGVLGFRRTLVAADLVRLASIGLLVVAVAFPGVVAVAFPGVIAVGGPGVVAAVVIALLALEFAAAVGSATREAVISNGVDPASFPAMNAATGALAYGLLPVGGTLAAVALRIHPLGAFAVCAAGYATTAALFAVAPGLSSHGRFLGGHLRRVPGPDDSPDRGAARDRDPDTNRAPRVSPLAGLRRVAAAGPLRDTVAVATAGILAVAMLFSLGPRVAELLVGDVDAYGLLLGLVGVGALGGGLLAQRRDDASLGLLAGAAGSVALLGPAPVALAGLVVLGAGAGLAYVSTQARLQRVASTPEEFAAAFAVVRVGLLGAVVAAPALYTVVGPSAPVIAMAAIATLGALWCAGRLEGVRLTPRLVRAVGRPLLRGVCSIQVAGPLPPGGLVLASNHPSYLDGLIAVYLDPRVRPVAKPQRSPLIRLGYRLQGTIMTSASVIEEAVAHLRSGGIVWIVPEGRLNAGPTLLPPRLGAARMAAGAAVPILPMALRYNPSPSLRVWRPWRRIHAEVSFGAPIIVPGDADPLAASAAVMAVLSRLTGKAATPTVASVQPPTAPAARPATRPSTSPHVP